jgi:hypothetical protein
VSRCIDEVDVHRKQSRKTNGSYGPDVDRHVDRVDKAAVTVGDPARERASETSRAPTKKLKRKGIEK